MNFQLLPCVAKEKIFKYLINYFSEYKHTTFFYRVLALREVNREFHHEMSKILYNFFTLKNTYHYNITTFEDAKSVFLKGILANYSGPGVLKLLHDHNGRLICENCEKILSDEAFLLPEVIGYPEGGGSIERFDPRYNIICWDCVLTWSLAHKEPYCRLEDNINTCHKVKDFISKLIDPKRTYF